MNIPGFAFLVRKRASKPAASWAATLALTIRWGGMPCCSSSSWISTPPAPEQSFHSSIPFLTVLPIAGNAGATIAQSRRKHLIVAATSCPTLPRRVESIFLKRILGLMSEQRSAIRRILTLAAVISSPRLPVLKATTSAAWFTAWDGSTHTSEEKPCRANCTPVSHAPVRSSAMRIHSRANWPFMTKRLPNRVYYLHCTVELLDSMSQMVRPIAVHPSHF